MNRYQNNNDEISVYVCRGDVCNRVSLDGRGQGQGRVKENYDDQTLTIDSIATKKFAKTWLLNETVTIEETQTLTINAGETLAIGINKYLSNLGTIINNGHIQNGGLFTNKGRISNSGMITSTTTFQCTGGNILNNGRIIINDVGSFKMTGIIGICTLTNLKGGQIIITADGNFTFENTNIENLGEITNNGLMQIYGSDDIKNVSTIINNKGVILNNKTVLFRNSKDIFMFGNSITSGVNSECYFEADLLTDCIVNKSD